MGFSDDASRRFGKAAISLIRERGPFSGCARFRAFFFIAGDNRYAPPLPGNAIYTCAVNVMPARLARC
jgi:hypothetical protein